MGKWTVESYQDRRGRFPVDDYIESLQPKDTARLTRMIDLLEESGPMLRMPHARHLGGKIWELRVDGRPNSYRVLYAALPGGVFLLLHAFAKKTDKTPEREIAIAERRLEDYLGGET